VQIIRQLRRNPLSFCGFLIVLVWIIVALFAKQLAPYDPLAIVLADRLRSPSVVHLLGTDYYGRDIMTRIMYGSRYDLTMAVLAVAFAAGVGVPLGMIAGYFGGRVDNLIMRMADILMAFPALVLAMALAAALGPGLGKAIFVMALVGTAGYARLGRASTLGVKEEAFVEAARGIGVPNFAILVRHIFPNIISPIIVRATLGMGNTVLLGASLSFIGLGIRPPAPEWGAIINEGRIHLVTGKWWVATFAGLAIMSLVLGFNLLGDGLRDIIDPRRGKR